ncbi:flippase [Gibbsiella dentisursi]|uniref:Flippase n=1 Tax=Gibbsiella dentisursi TaxID=796890 RepID=A0ABP7KP32_9GAMM
MDIKVISNSIWMIIEKIVSIFGLIFVTSYVAKYIGPENFGKITFVSSIFIIVQTIAMFGSEHILLKRVSKNRVSGIKLMLSTVKLRNICFFLISAIVLSVLYTESDHVTFVFGVATAAAFYFTTIDVYSVYNNAILSSKINTICNVIGLTISLLVRLGIAKFELNFLYLSIPIILVTFIPYLMKRSFFFKRNSISKQFSFKKELKYSKYMFFSGIPLAISTVSVIIYARLAQFFIMKFGGNEQLGIFAVGSQLATAWTFVTAAIITSYFARIYETRDKTKAINMAAKLNGLVFLIAIFIVFCINVFGQFVINILYGVQFSQSYDILMIMTINSLCSCMGPIANKYIIYESGYNYLSKKMIAVMIITVPISYYLTSKYGMYGAAYGTVLTEFLSLTLLNYFFNKGVVLKIHLKALNPRTYIK